MKKAPAILLIFILISASALSAGCGWLTERLTDVRIAIQGNAGGAPLAGIASEKGFFKQEGINAVITLYDNESAEIAAMRADQPTIDCGYIGADAAWNVTDPRENGLSFLLLDNLSSTEVLLARKGIFSDTNANGFYDYREIYEGLKGKTVHIDTTSSSGGWFRDLIDKIHSTLAIPDAEKLWIAGGIDGYPSGYTAPNSNEEFKVTVVQTANADVAAGMSAEGADRIDIAVAYAPVPASILSSDSNIVQIAATATHLANQYFPATWVADDRWIAANPDIVQKVVNALYKALIYRSGSLANRSEALAAGERIAAKAAGSFDAASVVWPTKAEYKEWFANTQGMGYTYMRSLYNAKKTGLPAGVIPKSFEDCFADSFLLKAAADIG